MPTMAPAVLLPLLVRARWAQLAGPLTLGVLLLVFVPMYYPVLAKG